MYTISLGVPGRRKKLARRRSMKPMGSGFTDCSHPRGQANTALEIVPAKYSQRLPRAPLERIEAPESGALLSRRPTVYRSLRTKDRE
jgi:hypothetical protein